MLRVYSRNTFCLLNIKGQLEKRSINKGFTILSKASGLPSTNPSDRDEGLRGKAFVESVQTVSDHWDTQHKPGS